MSRLSKRQVVGWLAVTLSIAITCFWSFWGIIENFHEGWFHESLLLNVGLMFLQYLSPMIIFVSLTLFAIAFPRVGSLAHVLAVLLLLLFLFDLATEWHRSWSCCRCFYSAASTGMVARSRAVPPTCLRQDFPFSPA